MKRDILIIPGYCLFPLETGAAVAQYTMIDYLRLSWNVSILIDSSNVEASHLAKLIAHWGNVEIITWDTLKSSWEHYASKSLKYRVSRKLGIPKRDDSNKPRSVQDGLEDVWKNVSILYYEHPEWEGASLKYFLMQRKFDIVQTDLPYHLQLANYIPSGIKRVHVCHELKSNRLKSSAEMLNIYSDEINSLVRQVSDREMHLLSRYDLCLCFSEIDRSLIQSGTDIDVQVSPFSIPDSEFTGNSSKSIERFVFIGPENHGPNKEGLLWFLEYIWPNVTNDFPLHVIGRWGSDTIAELSSERVRFEGFVDDLTPFFTNSIIVVPVNSGAGIRTKIIQAMAQGVPVLATSFAAQGIGVEDKIHIGLFENQEEFQERLHLFLDEVERNTITAAAFELVKTNYNSRILGTRRSCILEELLD